MVIKKIRKKLPDFFISYFTLHRWSLIITTLIIGIDVFFLFRLIHFLALFETVGEREVESSRHPLHVLLFLKIVSESDYVSRPGSKYILDIEGNGSVSVPDGFVGTEIKYVHRFALAGRGFLAATVESLKLHAERLVNSKRVR